MKLRRVALILFYNDKKEILLQDRTGISKFGEEWGQFGGSIEEGETPEQAVIRETKEELNFNLKEHKYIGEVNNQLREDLFVERYVFIAPLKNHLSSFTQLEGTHMQLFSIDEARKLKMVPGDEMVIEALEKAI